MLLDTLKDNENYVSDLQKISIIELSKIFSTSTNHFSFNNYFYKGTYGKYQGKDVYCINFKFNYNSYDFDFYISYNQLEYYISKNDKILFECNLEDFWDDNKLLNKFIEYLLIDIDNLKII